MLNNHHLNGHKQKTNMKNHSPKTSLSANKEKLKEQLEKDNLKDIIDYLENNHLCKSLDLERLKCIITVTSSVDIEVLKEMAQSGGVSNFKVQLQAMNQQVQSFSRRLDLLCNNVKVTKPKNDDSSKDNDDKDVNDTHKDKSSNLASASSISKLKP